MLRYVFTVIFLVFLVSISEGLEVGDSALRTTITSGDVEIKLADFHGKSNLIVVRDLASNSELKSELDRKASAFESTYDATIIRLEGEGETLIIDKSGYVRWKFPVAGGSAQLTIKQVESELAKLKRDAPLPIGSPAPDFRLVDVETSLPFSFSNYKGKKHLLITLLLQTY